MKKLNLFTLLTVSLFSTIIYGEDVGSILDRLEKRLSNEEGQTLTFHEQKLLENTPAVNKKKADKVLQFNGTDINADLKENDDMLKLSDMVSNLENDIEKFASEVHKEKQNILEKSKINNFIEIDTYFPETDKASIRILNIKLDGYKIYDLDGISDLWLPTKYISVYSGPMSPGTHQLQLEARLSLKYKNNLPLNNNIYRVVNKNLTLKVPDGKIRKKWTIEIMAPKGHKDKPKVKLIKS